MQITLKQLEAFVRIADLGSFRAAAERLNTTQPNISARIGALETALNTSLMDRDAGSVRLTPRGRLLLEHARRVLGEAEALVAASGETQLIEGTLRLGVTELIVHTWLRDLLRTFRERFPGVSVELTVDMSAALEQELLARTIDLAIQNGPFTHTATGSVDLDRYKLIWVAAPGLGLHGRGPLTAAELAAHPILTHARGTWPHREVAEHFRALPGVAARLVPSSNLAACLQMSIDAMGVAALPRAMVLRELAAGDLVALDYPWAPQNLDFVARFDTDIATLHTRAAAGIASDVARRFRAERLGEE